ncbi:MAG TPA: hypothetical protein VEL76_05785 [Gemmataceae bacterium]|nr:hypothetical protein [Gemmataceae bacterium]
MRKRVGVGIALGGIVLLLAGCGGTQGEDSLPPKKATTKAANPKDVTLHVEGMVKRLSLF